MKKSTIVAIVSTAVAVIGLMMLGLEALDQMDPAKLRIYVYLTAVGVGGLLGSVFYKLRRRQKRAAEKQEESEASPQE